MITLFNQRNHGRTAARASALCLLALAAALFGAQEARAQWTAPDSAGNINTTNTGNVGVGTSTPSAGVHVVSRAAGTAAVKVKAAAGQTANLLEFRAPDDTVRSYFGANGAFFMSPIMDQVPSAITLAPTFNGAYYASAEHNTFVINGANMANYGLYTNPTVRMFLIRDVNGFNAVEVNKIGMTTFRGDMSNRSFVANINVDSSNAYYANAADGLLINGKGLGNHGLYSGGALRLLRVVGTGEAMAVTRENLTGFGTLTPGARVEIVGTGSTTATGALSVKNSSASPLLSVRDNGRVGIGTDAPAEALDVVGNINVRGNINAKYQDVAEWVPTTQKLAAGTVVVLDTARDNHVAASFSSYDTRVAGVISAQPGISLGEAGEGKALVATTGRVKVKVDATRGPVGVGDLLVTSDRPGYAMKSEPVLIGKRQFHSPGTIIGKALEPLAGGTTGEILVLLSLQ